MKLYLPLLAALFLFLNSLQSQTFNYEDVNYKLGEALLSSLVGDYDGCVK